MAAEPDTEHLAIILWDPEPKAVPGEIRRRFPYIKVTYFCLKESSRLLADESGRQPEGVRAARYVFNELLLSSRKFDAETTSSRERLIGMSPQHDGMAQLMIDITALFKEATILATSSLLPPTPEYAPNLKLIHLFSAGVDHFAKHPIIVGSDIDITTSSGIHGPPIAEWVLMTTLAFSKHYNPTYDLQKQHVWGQKEYYFSHGSDWVGKRVGIAGYGSVGRQVARLFSALGCTILAYTASPRLTPTSRQDHGYIVDGTGDPSGTISTAWFSGTTKTDLRVFLSQHLDILVISLPLTTSTTNLFSTDEFEQLSAHPNTTTSQKCFLINIARGLIIDQPALVSALNEGLLRGAALDVAVPEPLPKEDPLWDAKNVIITPHISALGVEYQTRAFDVLMTNLARRQKGQKMFNLVDRKKGY